MSRIIRHDGDDSTRIDQHGNVLTDDTLQCADCYKTVHIGMLFKCLYCWLWRCEECSEKHFGKTQEEWDAEQT